VDAADFHAMMDREKSQTVSSLPEEHGDWKDRGYSPWKVSSAASRKRAKRARLKALRTWREKKRRTRS
jgi:hypothetical protein